LKHSITLLFILGCIIQLRAQERLAPLYSNPVLLEQAEQLQRSGSRNGENNQFIYLFDTLSLPFIDDFTTNKVKDYRFDPDDPSITKTPIYGFRIETDFPEFFEAMYDTSYNFTFDSITNTWDSTQNPVTLIEILDPDSQFITQVDTVWIKPNGRLIGDSLDTIFQADFVYINTFDTIFVIPSSGPEVYWTSNSAYINNSYGILPPSYGVATFDGLDSAGQPYAALSATNSYGQADVFTSAPIDLVNKPFGGGVYTVADSIYLSFFYQPQGRGEIPEEKDSLVLEFYDVDQRRWDFMWKAEGQGGKPFEQVFIKFELGKYFRDGFRFRFRNYATLNGAFDHWNIDYVRLFGNRGDAPNTPLDDVALTEHATGILADYTQMPWNHFKVNPSAYMADTAQSVAMNNFTANKNVRFGVEVYEQGTKVFNTDFSQNTEPQFQPQSSLEKSIDITPFVFSDTSTAKRYTFDVRHVLNTTPDVNRANDTLTYAQDFGTFYSYDDGTAENAYYLVSSGAELAVEFNMQVEDTLRAINMYFLKSGEDITNRLFRVKVWSSLNPEEVLYESAVQNPRYSFGPNRVERYEIDPIAVSGKFYIGYEQLTDPIILGFDRNSNARLKTFYSINSVWSQGSFEGAVMIHPEFDSIYYPWSVNVPELTANEPLDMAVYPNPANEDVMVDWGESNEMRIQLFDLQGRIVLDEQHAGENARLTVGNLSSGLYLVRIESLIDQRTLTKRLMIR